MSWINRLLGSLRKNKLEDQLNDELRFHIEMRTEEFIAAGVDPEDARYRARRVFGNQLLLKERTRDMDTIGWIETLWQDLSYAGRLLVKNPAFAAVAVLTLALGIGASTAIFSVVDAVLLRALPYPNPQKIVRVWEQAADGHGMQLADPNFDDFRSQNNTFAHLAEFAELPRSVSGGSEPVRVHIAEVTSGFFEALGVAPFRGRAFARRTAPQRPVGSHRQL